MKNMTVVFRGVREDADRVLKEITGENHLRWRKDLPVDKVDLLDTCYQHATFEPGYVSQHSKRIRDERMQSFEAIRTSICELRPDIQVNYVVDVTFLGERCGLVVMVPLN